MKLLVLVHVVGKVLYATFVNLVILVHRVFHVIIVKMDFVQMGHVIVIMVSLVFSVNQS